MEIMTKNGHFDLVDLSEVSLEKLGELPESVFARSLRRIMGDIEQPHDVVAGWNSAI
ncbi:FxSxx-COOH protein [Solwaraspora sp. WMMD1047]|uniref:FxSxx-COOH cyclophane-containing RiPP peptide n=1 Tax=Solwaraspora sp. WMMD1047 TaxID=3016102 RepID=UPI0024167D63|nr:FxSxx-COOH cyclophane-containing RiPP peptide [Solwaraspora sp. WMMD1047]MDG4831523.1 FxSxx-COOH protein [Solwaraspora sp. WMMD1047]